MSWGSRGAWLALGGAAVVGVGIGLAVTGWPWSGGRVLPPARARVYKNVDACLLAGPRGVGAPPDSGAWAALEGVSGNTDVRVSYLQVTGPGTEGNAVSFLGSLVVRGCRVIVAADAPERSAVEAQARRFSSVRFVVVGGSGGGGGNVTALPAGSARLGAVLDSAVRAAGG